MPRRISDEHVITQKRRGRKKRVTAKIICCKVTIGSMYANFRTLVAVDDPLNLLYRCNCALFKQQKVSAAFPSMTDNIGRSKPMHDMIELANLPSIVYGSNFSRAAKELELLDENSRYLNSTGLALAMAAHKKNCFTYAKAIAGAKGRKFTHPSLFNGDPGYNIDAYFDQALIRCDKIVQSDFED
ncbi:unnamed protein product [Nippostrongylus brasiliensis]|uniref:SCP domain-containing protein n=1 Tax=Nippostrongylus brasiliensis TaxID=27835 RepID=A0A0N4YRT6_NIPBR|nr:unnamed protein product [Nippostrongylus brasiliensis]